MPNYEGLIKYPVPTDMYNSTYGEPQWWADFAVTTRAEIETRVAEGNFVKPFSGVGGDFNDLTTPGLHGYWSDWANRPSDTSGTVFVLPAPQGGTSGARGQIAFPYGSGAGIWYRFSGASGETWSSWTQLDAGAVEIAENGGGGSSASAMKRVPLILTAATATGSESSTGGAIRFPIHYGAGINRWRVHVSNHNHASGASFTGGGNISGMWFGPGFNGAFTSTPTQVAWPMTIPDNGSDAVTPWISTPIPANTQNMLSIGWYSTSETKVRTAGGGWVSVSSASASAQSGTGYVLANAMPYDWWIEAEVPATTPTVAGYGDSITAGTGTDLLVYSSWLSQYGRKEGILPVHWAYPGSGMILWMSPGDQKWSRWADMDKADAVIHFMGQNDLGTAESAAVMQERFETTLPMVKTFISPNVSVATITPHANKTEAQNTVRREYEDYLRTLPLGVRDLFDFAAAVSSDDIALKPEYRGGAGTDELHPNAAGGLAMANAITRKVTAENPVNTYLTARGA